MSGVFGVVGANPRGEVERLLKTMGMAMTHGDWYVVESHADPERGVTLGRIGIGIFNRGPQPVWNVAHTIALVMAGELYEMAAPGQDLVPACDELAALALYERYGADFARHLEGIFLIAVWDTERDLLLIANDRFGLYPLFYAHYDGKLIFAPEMKGILCDPGYRKVLDLTALAQYMRFQHVLGDRTFFEGLHILPGAALLRYDIAEDRLTVRQYWDLGQLPALPSNLSCEDAAEESGRLLQAAVARRMEGDYRFGVYLSGGMDSRAILGLIDRRRFPITTITFGLRNSRDVYLARKLAARAGSNHRWYEFPDGKWVQEYADLHLELTEGFQSWIHSHGISILAKVRSLIDVNLSGYHGQELNWEDRSLYEAQDDLAFATRLFYALTGDTTWPSMGEIEERSLYSVTISEAMRDRAFDSLRAEIARYAHLPRERLIATLSYEADRKLYQFQSVFSRSHIEQRFPFLDNRYVEFVHALPPTMLFKRRLRRAVLLRRAPDMARIPYDRDLLPITEWESARLLASLLEKGKSYINHHVAALFPEPSTLYADYENWLRNELGVWGEDLLVGERTLRRGLFNRECLLSLWQRHLSGVEENTIGMIAPIMTYEMMLRRLYD